MDRRFSIIGVATAVLAVAVVIGIASKGSNDDSGSSDAAPISTNLDEKPEIGASSDPPPRALETDDIVAGDGDEAKAGDQISVQYVGVDYATGAEFDSSWDREPLDFQLGSGQVIPGWDQGIEGMKVGGRRELTIPPDLAYGPQGQPPSIGPNATLVFVVDLLDVT